MNKVIDLLTIKNTETIGSSSDSNIKYASDIDLQEIIETDDLFPEILQKFRTKFIIAGNDPNIFIIDMKCGMFRGQPVRWDKHDIKRGYKTIDDITIQFINCLQQKSIIKMDIIALIDGVFTEFSNNYYFTFPDGFSTMPIQGNKIEDVMMMEFQKKIKEKKYFKALKRLYSYFKLEKNKEMINKLLRFFNSDVGKLNYQINGLGIIDEVIGNSFRKPKKSDIVRNLLIIRKNLPDQYHKLVDRILLRSTVMGMKEEIKNVMTLLNDDVNDKTMQFIDNEIDYMKIYLNKISNNSIDELP